MPQAQGVEEITQRLAGAKANAAATLEVSLGRVAAALEKQERRNERLYQLLHLAPITGAMILAGGAGTLDQADRYGPKDGYLWDLRRVTVSGFTAGTVTMYRNDTNGAQLAQWTTPGEWTWSTAQWLKMRDRLIWVATGITGTVVIDGEAIEVSNQVLPEYLL